MTNITQLPWTEPLVVASECDVEPMALLFSGATHGHTGRYSYLGVGAQVKIISDSVHALDDAFSCAHAWYENFWVGWLGYGLKNQLEQLPEDVPSFIQTPNIGFFKPETIYRFDHQTNLVECIGEHILKNVWESQAKQSSEISKIQSLKSNMTSEEYLQKAQFLIDEISAGTLYQANLTRKYYGEFDSAPNGFGLFQKLCGQSPAAYSAYIRLGGVEIISSSPEQFLQISSDGKIKTRPIKGTMARKDNQAQDDAQKLELMASAKDKAENLMIVDLMRHDFAGVCETASVKVDALFDITTHAHIHHMSSTISGQIKEGISALAATLACFPAGSMTGAPKIRAMRMCTELEYQARGIYSGALGWFGGDGSAELSVVIRTIILQGKKIEFQAGGGIVADSTPEKELAEMLAKTAGIRGALDIKLETLQNL